MNLKERTIVTILFILFFIGVSYASFETGRIWQRDQIPVCHANTEDSVITDCDYHDGAWHQK